MPVYNGEKFVRQALDSLLCQTHENFELIISDNASTDSTRSICLDYAKQDKRIKFIENKENIGALKNFQKVLDLADAHYFMWAAHDDLWESNYISTLIDNMVNDKIVLSYSVFNNIDENGIEIVNYPQVLDIPANDLYQRLSNYINQYERLGKANPIYGLMQRTYAKSAFNSVLNLFADDIWGSDMLFVFQLLTLGGFAVAEQTLFHKRVLSSTSLSSNPPDDFYSYFNGYKYLIVNSLTLSEIQKKSLIAEINDRQTRSKVEKLGNTVFPKYFLIEEDVVNFSVKESYSRSGEDLIVKSIFESMGIFNPSYIDIGAFHPEIFSNTALFYKMGNNGINIEANPHFINDFLVKRPKDTNLNLIVGLENKSQDFYVMSIPALSTFSQDESQRIILETKHTLKEVLPVKVETITTILDKYANHSFPEFLSLSTKAIDLELIQSIDFNQSYPIVICVRTMTFSKAGEGIKNRQIIDYLESQGYFSYADTYINTIFIKEDLWKQKNKINRPITFSSNLWNANSNNPYDPIYLVKKLYILLDQLSYITSQLEVEKEKSESLENSNFWKLRNTWFKLKNLFGKEEYTKENLNEKEEKYKSINLSQAMMHSKSYDPKYLEEQIKILSDQIDFFLAKIKFEREKIAGIESSKFWKLRKVWIKLKSYFKTKLLILLTSKH